MPKNWIHNKSKQKLNNIVCSLPFFYLISISTGGITNFAINSKYINKAIHNVFQWIDENVAAELIYTALNSTKESIYGPNNNGSITSFLCNFNLSNTSYVDQKFNAEKNQLFNAWDTKSIDISQKLSTHLITYSYPFVALFVSPALLSLALLTKKLKSNIRDNFILVSCLLFNAGLSILSCYISLKYILPGFLNLGIVDSNQEIKKFIKESKNHTIASFQNITNTTSNSTASLILTDICLYFLDQDVVIGEKTALKKFESMSDNIGLTIKDNIDDLSYKLLFTILPVAFISYLLLICIRNNKDQFCFSKKSDEVDALAVNFVP